MIFEKAIDRIVRMRKVQALIRKSEEIKDDSAHIAANPIILDQILELDPGNLYALKNKGIYLTTHELDDDGQFDKAVDCLNKVLKKDSRDRDALYHKTIALFRSGRYKEALECLARALEEKPQDPILLSIKGTILAELELDKEALKCFDKAIGSFKGPLKDNLVMREIFYKKANTLMGLNLYGDAIVFYDKALKIRPDAGVFFNRGWSQQDLVSYEEALESFDESLRIDPAFLHAWHHKGEVLEVQGKKRQALECYRSALAIAPAFIPSLRRAVAISYDGGHMKKGMGFIERAVRFDPHDGVVLFAAGEILLDLNLFKDALRYLDRALKVCPKTGRDSVLALRNRAMKKLAPGRKG